MSKKFMAAGAVVGAALLAVGTYGAVVSADHAWGNPAYHWPRQTHSFDLLVVNSTTSDWDPYVTQATLDWSISTSLKMVEEGGSASKKVRRRCNPVLGKVRICNDKYGSNGWLGVAGVWFDGQGHITQGYTKLNDTYFSTPYYSSDLWKQSVTCQELGHDIGLDHQGEDDFNNPPTNSCMDYQDPPWDMPNGHDYEQLDGGPTVQGIYDHLDSYDSYYVEESGGGGGGGGSCNAPPGKGCNKSGVGQGNAAVGWGLSLGRRGNHERFLRIDPDGMRVVTHVRWVEGHESDHGHDAH